MEFLRSRVSEFSHVSLKERLKLPFGVTDILPVLQMTLSAILPLIAQIPGAGSHDLHKDGGGGPTLLQLTEGEIPSFLTCFFLLL